MGKGSSSPPPAPDYTGAANAQGAASEKINTQQTWANRPTQTTPWGKSSWQSSAATDPSTGQPVTAWEQTQTLDPKMQGALDSQLGIQQGRSDLAEGFMGRVGEAYEKPFDWGGMPAAAGGQEQAQKEAYGRMQSFQAPERAAQGESFRTRLANQGITEGSTSYDRAMRGYQDQQGRQDLQNLQASFGEGRTQGAYQSTIRQQAIAEEAMRRGMPLNEMNALLTGQQVQQPGMPSFHQAGKGQTPDLLGAANMAGNYGMNAWQQQQDQMAQQNAGYGQLAGTAATAAAMFAFSDVRLKSNLCRIGTHPRGVGIYAYEIFGRHEIGVIAQELVEVAPELVAVHPSGFLIVNYGAL